MAPPIDPWRAWLVGVWRLAQRVVRRFHEDRCTRVAGSLSYTTVLAAVPFTAVALSILSVFPVFQSWVAAINRFVYGNFVPASGEVVEHYLNEFATKAGGLTTIGLLVLVATSIMLLATIEDAFNDIWRVTGRRRAMQRFVTFWAILTLGPILIGAGVSLSNYLSDLNWFSGESLFAALLLGAVPLIFEFLTFMLLYTVVPRIRVRRRHALVGAVLAALLFELAKRGFALFVSNFSSYHLIYGALAALPVFLVWVYLSWLVTLLGAELVATLGSQEADDRAVTMARVKSKTRNTPRRRKAGAR